MNTNFNSKQFGPSLVAVLMLVGCALGSSNRKSPDQATDTGGRPNGSPRLIAVGDLHADMVSARTAFRFAGAIDEHDEWVGGEMVVVQLIVASSYKNLILDFISICFGQ
ncbi:MAG: hypothetical protein GY847_35745 [Proteobacteria bacterium]|nr:hypothetical protein [Pseudomonadota bacterium]